MKEIYFLNNLSIALAVPTRNAGSDFKKFIAAVRSQDGLAPEDVLVVDSSSLDGTADLARAAGFRVKVIPAAEFSHGGTRAEIVESLSADIVAFLTQDAILADNDAVAKLVSVFRDPSIAAAYGRQLPHRNTSPFGAFARLFNYGERSFVNKLEDRKIKGIKTAFLSDSFAAYRREALLSIGNFDKSLQYGEDTIAAAKLLMAGYRTAYCAEARVYHAHSNSIAEEYARYKETGRFHKEQHWLPDEFGRAEGEGLRFVKAELRYLCEQGKWYLLPLAFIRSGAKFLGYRMGRL